MVLRIDQQRLSTGGRAVDAVRRVVIFTSRIRRVACSTDENVSRRRGYAGGHRLWSAPRRGGHRGSVDDRIRFRPGGQRPPNRLAQETSPYLRLHMHNPVDWYPWGEEAFAKARRENKLVFLSVGYSSCYWCHVMERESFTDDEIAAFLNEHFVCIKVDREERPDVDSIYMLAVQIVTGRGGWPMSVFLLPNGKPFSGATYFPARDDDRAGATGFLTVIRRLQELWTTRAEEAHSTADRLTEAIQAEMQGPVAAAAIPLDAELPAKIVTALAASFDDQYGGFGYSSDDPQHRNSPRPRICSSWSIAWRGPMTPIVDGCSRPRSIIWPEGVSGTIWEAVFIAGTNPLRSVPAVRLDSSSMRSGRSPSRLCGAGTVSPPSRRRIPAACCSASTSVGAIRAAW